MELTSHKHMFGIFTKDFLRIYCNRNGDAEVHVLSVIIFAVTIGPIYRALELAVISHFDTVRPVLVSLTTHNANTVDQTLTPC